MQDTAGNNKFIIADGRWSGANGIGRFSREILARLQCTDVFTAGPKPLSLQNLFWQTAQLKKFRTNYHVYFTPGFNPVLRSTLPYVLTVHDLIHLFFPGNAGLLKKAYYQTLLKPAMRRAHKILTVSNYSKQTLLEWSGVPAEKVVVVSCGVSNDLTPAGEKFQPGFPYLLHVGNTKAHKNCERLLAAFHAAEISDEMRLIFTGTKTSELARLIAKYRLENRVLFCQTLDEVTLQSYYRGASAVVFPSLYEGFGLPVIEAMALGTPVLTANVTSLPEAAGDAALLVDPYSTDSMKDGIVKIVNDAALQKQLRAKGLMRAKLFSWDETAHRVQKILDEFK